MRIKLQEFTDPSFFIKEIEVDPGWVNDFGEEYHLYRKGGIMRLEISMLTIFRYVLK